MKYELLALAVTLLGVGCFQVVKNRAPEPRGSGLDHRGRQSDTANIDAFALLDASKEKNDSLDVAIAQPSGIEIERATAAGDTIIIVTQDGQKIPIAKSDITFDYAYGVGKRPIIAVKSHTPRRQYVIYCHDDGQKRRYFGF